MFVLEHFEPFTQIETPKTNVAGTSTAIFIDNKDGSGHQLFLRLLTLKNFNCYADLRPLKEVLSIFKPPLM